MTIRLKLLSAVAASAAVFVGAAAGPAVALSEPLYSYIYYSDATRTVQVGSWQGVCYNGWAGVTQFPDGQVTQYEERVRIGTCTDGGTIYE